MYSVLILTLNEERNLPRCLASVASCDDIVVLDSGSTDRTVEIARAAGARVFQRAFDNFAAQHNHAQKEIPFRHRWVFHLDADERFTPELADECRMEAQRTDLDGFFVAPKMMFHGRWIRHCTDFPAWQARFVRAPKFRFVEVGHGQREDPAMRMGCLRSSYLHDLSSGGDEEWLAKHRRYARAEAKRHLANGGRERWSDLLRADRLARRRALKRLSYGLPFRPTLRLIYQYLLRGGFLDGPQGWRYCRLLAQYESFTAEELRRAANRYCVRAVRVIFVNRFYWPDEPATGQLLTDLAEALAAAGHDVSVIASQPPLRTMPREVRRGVAIIRVRSTRLSRSGIAGKAIDYSTFYVAALAMLARTAQAGTAIVAMTDPPLLGIGAWLIARLRRARIVQWIQDIYPEIAIALSGQHGLAALKPLRNVAWRRSDACVTLGTDMAAVVKKVGVAAARLHIVPNAAPAGLHQPAGEPVQRVQQAWGVADKFVVAYSGNLGRVHDLDRVLDVAEALRDAPHIAFVLIGDGAQRARLEALARERTLPNVQFQPPQPREMLSESLAAADAHLVTLRAGCENFVFPSKFHGIVAAGRPIVFIGPAQSEVARAIKRHGLGVAFPPDAVASVAAAIRGWANDCTCYDAIRKNVMALEASSRGSDQPLSSWLHLFRALETCGRHDPSVISSTSR